MHLHPGAYRAIMALCRCTDAAKGQMLDVFSATKKKGRLALFKKFCKRDFCDEVRDFKIPEPEAVAS